jgi:hypothetical protein
MKIKLLENHSKNCIYVTNRVQNPDSPWFLDTYKDPIHFKLSASGDKRGDGFRWLKFVCNDTRCKGRGIIRVDTLQDAIGQALKEQAK